MAVSLRYSSIKSNLRVLKSVTKSCFCNQVPVRNFNVVGFVGLGNMGEFMARNLLKKGQKVAVYDVINTPVDKLQKEGATACSNLQEVASKSECIITMLPNAPDVYKVFSDKGGLFESAKKGTVFIDSSTVDPEVPQTLAASAEKFGCSFLDAPVSGGVIAAEAGSLTFMVGGKKENFTEDVKKTLLMMGSRAEYCGKSGLGQAAKICNNMLLGISMIGVSEAMCLGGRMGLDQKLLMSIINSSTGRCWSSEKYNPVPGTLENVPSNNNYKGGFAVRLMTKDLGLAQNAATKTLTSTPMGSAAHQIFRVMANSESFANKDFAAVYKFLQGIYKLPE